MTTETFFKLAELYISDNPNDRLPDSIQQVLQNKQHDVSDLMIDVHAHCFTLNHVPKKFAGPKWLQWKPTLWTIEQVLNIIAKLTKMLQGKGSEYYKTFAKRRFLTRFTMGKSSNDMFKSHWGKFNYYFNNILQGQRPPHLIICELMMDMERGIEGGVPSSFYQQMQELSDLRKIKQNEAMLLPFLALDPRNPNLYEDFLAVFTRLDARQNQTGQTFLDDAFPFFGVKLYPSLGYLPSDPKLMDIFKVCEAKKIPVTTHCGGGSVCFSADKISGNFLMWDDTNRKLVLSEFNKDYSQMRRSEKGDAVAKFFNAPYNWIAVAEAYPDLKINLAHFGGSEEWDTYRDSNGQAHTHIHETLYMVEKYPKLYADISYAYATRRNMEKIKGMLYDPQVPTTKQKIYQAKFLHGSDFCMTEQEKHIATITKNLFEIIGSDRNILNRVCIENPIDFLLK